LSSSTGSLPRRDARVLVVGVGGLGCPASLALALAGVGHLGLCDDDVVERTNLHRQILFDDADVGAPKLEAAARALNAAAPGVQVELHPERLTPASAARIVASYDLVVEGSDNFATKFLTADACGLAGVAVVHASAVRWIGTAMAVGPTGHPCYRCVFEDLADLGGRGGPSCSEAGVMGPVVGVMAAIQADLALSVLDGVDVTGELVSFDGRTDALRRRRVRPRSTCPLCGGAPSIRRIDSRAYEIPACAAD
jgi:molybdopterin/thiamine biosynthesis adenylyltransferase